MGAPIGVKRGDDGRFVQATMGHCVVFFPLRIGGIRLIPLTDGISLHETVLHCILPQLLILRKCHIEGPVELL